MKNKILSLLTVMGLAAMADNKSMPVFNSNDKISFRPQTFSRRFHNNRKTTRGRRTQYIPIGEGRFKPIYH